ncbi:1-acyl-sn-glycerol-3-phosphate acyltransferases [Pseudonocardia ammonioxydans]|uniref:1-acyl-sn-glycerol-3-phosphate acyltransferases n=1 Tax=Pseudonocardia ammonioxydans TaxID=260086 RepID=A0A1I5GAV6_PSUAM|nr:lysophospholipid acyltransferase family protein [Pseudonocardia ammonioxydans]SFO33062.1 1-acyl-sn-glycerol-3-phosphate acyltransferases [Pseudonocardia ammonioxydans]
MTLTAGPEPVRPGGSALRTSTHHPESAPGGSALRTDTHHPGSAPGGSALRTPAHHPQLAHPTHPADPPAAERPGGPWATWSPCTPRDCLPARAATGRWRLARRLVVLLGVLALAVPLVPGAAVLGPRVLGPVLRVLHRAVLAAAGVRLVVHGAPLAPADGRGALVVADHTSWIDVPALGAIGPVTMLAKREVRDWPLIGTLAARTGTLFVHREGLSRLPGTVAATAAALRAGALVGVFPEATTWCGATGGTYRRAPFQAAIDAGAPVRPVTISITTPDGRPTTAAAFVGTQTLGDTVGRVLRLPGLVCEVGVGELIEPDAGDRRALAARARDGVRAPSGTGGERPAPEDGAGTRREAGGAGITLVTDDVPGPRGDHTDAARRRRRDERRARPHR